MINKEVVLKGLRCELNEKELLDIINNHQADLEYYGYYNLDLYLHILDKTINKEIEYEYFTSWCVLAMAALYRTSERINKKRKRELYNEVADFFDGIAFSYEYDKRFLTRIKAELRYYDYLINKNKRRNALYISNNIGRYMLEDHSNPTLDSDVYRVFVVDYKNKRYCLKYFDDYNYLYKDEINYNFIGFPDKFDDVFVDTTYDDDGWIEDNNLEF